MRIKNFKEAEDFLLSFKPTDFKKTYAGDWGLTRVNLLLELLGNPQNKIKVVHIAGTSGKGSTTYLISRILRGLGFRTGAHFSPHLLDIRERFQINTKLISKEKFIRYLNEVIPAIERISLQKPHVRENKSNYVWRPTYFEILASLAYYIFWKENVNYAVVETGLGGRFDATNTVNRAEKIVVLTRIGKDHTRILGNTLCKIAREKAGIMQNRNTVIALSQKPKVNKVINSKAEKSKVRLYRVKFRQSYYYVAVKFTKNYFNFRFGDENIEKIELGLLGRHQVENASLALAAVKVLSGRDKFKFNEQKIRKALKTAKFPGRFEVFKTKGKTIIIDGAHNPQKMGALVKSLKEIFPEKKFCFLIAFKRGKDIRGMLTKITQIADKIIVTSFKAKGQNRALTSEKPETIAKLLGGRKFENYKVIKGPNKALETLVEESNKNIIITGSLHLISQIYSALFQEKRIPRQQGRE